MSIEDGDHILYNILYNNAIQASRVIDLDVEAAEIRLEAARLELKRQKLLLEQVEAS